jgi:hypothetical protein
LSHDANQREVSRGGLLSPWMWLAAAASGAIACGAIYLRNPQAVLESYWLAVVGWTGLSVGALSILLVYALVGGRWGDLLGPPLAAATRPLWLMAVLWVLASLQPAALFPWAESGQRSLFSTAELSYFSGPWFWVRGASYFALWLVIAIALTGHIRERRGVLSGAIGLPLVVLAVTFASIDWMMSLEPQWRSAVFGLLVLAAQAAGACAFAIVIAAGCTPSRESESRPLCWEDEGNVLLATISFWMYFSFSQFLIVWTTNLPEEIPWYLERSRQPWWAASLALVGLHFALPFVLLLWRPIKRNPRWLGLVAALVLAMHAVDVAWLIAPAFGHYSLAAIGCDLLVAATVGAAWMVAFSLGPLDWQVEPGQTASSSAA